MNHRPANNPRTPIVLAAMASALLSATAAFAQSLPGSPSTPTATATSIPADSGRASRASSSTGFGDLTRAQTLTRLETRVDVQFVDHPLHDVVRYLSLVAQVPLEPLWVDELEPEDVRNALSDGPIAGHLVGLDPMLPVRLDAAGLTVLQALEAVLGQAASVQRFDDGATWQFSPTGGIEFGPRQRLNRPSVTRTEVYDIQDLLATLPGPPQAPRLNIGSAAQAPSPGSGAEDWIFPRDTAPPPDQSRGPNSEAELIELLTSLVEPNQWSSHGGTAVLSIYQGGLVVRAPDYVHRALVGPLGHGIRTELE